MIEEVADWLRQGLSNRTQVAAVDVHGREALLHPTRSSSSDRAALVRLREVAADCLDVWIEVSDKKFVGPFEVHYPEERVALSGLALAVTDGTATLRVARWGGGGAVSWPEHRWSTEFIGLFGSTRIKPEPYGTD